MKPLHKEVSLEGQQETITISDLRRSPGDVFLKVQMGKTFTVTKLGQPIATITRPEPTAFDLGSAVRKIKSSY